MNSTFEQCIDISVDSKYNSKYVGGHLLRNQFYPVNYCANFGFIYCRYAVWMIKFKDLKGFGSPPSSNIVLPLMRKGSMF